jgi:hypothetical protein
MAPPMIVNVRDKGAQGDNGAPDTAAFQAALTDISAAASQGGVLYVPNGTYKITEKLVYTGAKPISVIGDGMGLSVMRFSAVDTGFQFNMGQPPLNHLKVRGLTFNAASEGAGIAIDVIYDETAAVGCSATISDVHIKAAEGCHWTKGIRLRGGSYHTVQNVRYFTFEGAAQAIFHIDGYQSQPSFVFRFKDVEGNAADVGLLITGWVEGVVVDNAGFVGCKTGMLADATGTGNPNGRNPVLYVTGNHWNSKRHNIRVSKWEDVRVQGMNLYHGVGWDTDVAGTLAYFDDCRTVQVKDTTLVSPLGYPPAQGPDYGIELVNSTGVQVSDCIFKGTDECIHASGGDQVLVHGNMFLPFEGAKVASYAVNAAGVANALSTDNLVSAAIPGGIVWGENAACDGIRKDIANAKAEIETLQNDLQQAHGSAEKAQILGGIRHWKAEIADLRKRGHELGCSLPRSAPRWIG